MTSTLGKRSILVDADSCPVKMEIVEIAKGFEIEPVFVASYAHMVNDFGGAVWKFVDSSKEAADLFIMNHVKKGDVAVTQDIGLASTLLPKGVYVLSPRGTLYEEEHINTALDMRYLSAKARRRGQYGKGPKPFTQEDRSRFVKQLTKILSNLAGK
ncbi:YaiI/YqxD family protein [Bacillus infantis]|uniref:YaiI/YqxD family protein n=1 Tax=Bacillus infantis TaxID=324767 RepID=UPI0029EA024C|nr:YaiI/YqxD family protein [Bacillus infantis]